MLRLPNLPKLPDFFRSRKMDIIQRMRLRQYFTYAGILLILIFFGIAIATNMFNGGQKTEALNWWDCLPTATACTIDESVSIGTWSGLDNKDITLTGNIIVSFRGHHTFNSLTISNGATVTHNALLWADGLVDTGLDFDTDGTLNDSGVAKRIDFTILGRLTLTDGGNINVDGKGYPGGRIFNVWNETDTRGAGPGGGKSDVNGANAHLGSAGGSHGGSGGYGWNILNEGCNITGPDPGPIYDERLNPTLPGSGAGAAAMDGNGDHGGNGGGVVMVRADQILIGNNSYISANGEDGAVFGRGQDVGTGGGAGGSIQLYTNDGFLWQPEANGGSQSHCDVLSGINGSNVANQQDVNSALFATYNITAHGGDGGGGWGGGGGGGRILISDESEKIPSMQKILTPIKRLGLPIVSESDFNPYALREGDIIEVKINVLDVRKDNTVKDYFFRQPGGTYHCQPISASLSPDTSHGAVINTDNITWTAEADADSQEFNYRCEVTK